MSYNSNIYDTKLITTEKIAIVVCLFIILIFIFILVLNFIYLYRPISNLNNKVENITIRIDSTLDKINDKIENVDINNIVEDSLKSIESNILSIIKDDIDNVCENYVPLTPSSSASNQFLNSLLNQACDARLNQIV